MAPDPLSFFYVHTTTVKRLQGTTGYGDELYDAPADLPCLVDDTRRLVRDSQGVEVISETTVFYPTGTGLIPPGSLVTLPAAHGGREATVLTSAVQDAGPLPLPEHVEVNLA